MRSHTGGNLRKEHCNCSIFHSRVYIWVPFCPNFVHVFVRVYLSPTPELCPLSSVLAWGGGVFCWQDCFLSLTVVKGLRGPLRREEARRQGVQCRAVQGPEREAVQGQEESSLISASAASLPPTPNPHPCLPCLCSSLLLSAGD